MMGTIKSREVSIATGATTKFSPVLAVVWVSATLGAEIVFQEDFEGESTGQFVVNATNRKKDISINFASVSQEQAAGGTKSFKIDMTVVDGSFVY